VKSCSTPAADLITLNFSNNKSFTGIAHHFCLDISLPELCPYQMVAQNVPCLEYALPRIFLAQNMPPTQINGEFLVLVAPTHRRTFVRSIKPKNSENNWIVPCIRRVMMYYQHSNFN
jgi:hypothetical protein